MGIGNKAGFWERLQLAWYCLTKLPSWKMGSVGCEYCQSNNTAIYNRQHFDQNEHKVYTAEYSCRDCGAYGQGKQVWTNQLSNEEFFLDKQGIVHKLD